MTITPNMKRNFYLTLFFAVCVLTIGGFLFHDSEIGSYVVPGVAFFGGLFLFDAMNTRDWRRKESEAGTSSRAG